MDYIHLTNVQFLAVFIVKKFEIFRDLIFFPTDQNRIFLSPKRTHSDQNRLWKRLCLIKFWDFRIKIWFPFLLFANIKKITFLGQAKNLAEKFRKKNFDHNFQPKLWALKTFFICRNNLKWWNYCTRACDC